MMPFIAMLAMHTKTSGPYALIETMKSYGILCPIIFGMSCSALAWRSISPDGRFAEHMWIDRMDRSTKWAIATLVVLVAFVLILAFYGYVSGAWDANG
jgi:hypothetical protein